MNNIKTFLLIKLKILIYLSILSIGSCAASYNTPMVDPNKIVINEILNYETLGFYYISVKFLSTGLNGIILSKNAEINSCRIELIKGKEYNILTEELRST